MGSHCCELLLLVKSHINICVKIYLYIIKYNVIGGGDNQSHAWV